MTARVCRTCDHYAATAADGSQGECHAHAPSIFVISAPPSVIGGQPPPPGRMSCWPPTQPQLWCGEWKKKLEEFTSVGGKPALAALKE